MRTRVSVAALLAAGLLGAAALAGEDPATTRLEAPDATAGRMPDEQRARSRPPVRPLTTAGGGEVGVAASAQPLAAPAPLPADDARLAAKARPTQAVGENPDL